MKILVIDNYDSFTYNLVHYIEKLTGERPDVYRNDQISIEECKAYDKILLSPGPGIPVEAGICLDLIKELAPTHSIMGVCLGHQAIGEAFGGELENLSEVYHGVATNVKILEPGNRLYLKMPKTFEIGRYHSWVVKKDSLPDCFNVTCIDDEGLIMGLCHKQYNVQGVQFHPESVLTEHGLNIMRNWIEN